MYQIITFVVIRFRSKKFEGSASINVLAAILVFVWFVEFSIFVG